VGTTCLVCFIRTVNGHCNKKRKEKKKLTLGGPALVAGIQQTLSNLLWRLSISMFSTDTLTIKNKKRESNDHPNNNRIKHGMIILPSFLKGNLAKRLVLRKVWPIP
jgi:hypothetical protein